MAGEVERRSQGTPATTERNPSRFGGERRKTIYANVTDAKSGNSPPRNEYVYSGRRGLLNTIAGQEIGSVPVPSYLPRFLGNAKIVGYAWLASMVLIGFDEWHNNGILPRPSRLWYTSVVFGGLALAAIIPAIVPLANAFAIGYTLMLLWQYYNGEGQFTKS